MKFENINELIAALILWITSNTSFIELKVKPEVIFLNKEKLNEKACGRPCQIFAYTPENSKKIVYLIDSLKPKSDVCDQGILLHELIHVFQNNNGKFSEYENNTKKHMREMEALVLQNRYLSNFGKKILYSNGFAGKFKTQKKKDNLYC